ncbi:MAG TPA: cyanophycin synthetase [Kofleriaceae bacterium]|nr:cyanophycin synthetase [Kofleriaceae bacterium]
MADAYRELLDKLIAARRAGIVLGLERVREVLARLGNPERRLGLIAHIGGTNGKGSTAAMVASMARYAGKRVAVYTSPHLASLRERFVIDGEPASQAAVVAAAARVAAAGGDALTFFEQVTLVAFVLFADAGVDVSVVEVGLGGRLDATNVVDAEVAAVTGVAMDHEAMLGDSLRAITAEKAGIWKAGRRAVIGMSGEPEARAWLHDAAVAAGCANVHLVEPIDVARAPLPGLVGDHQRANAACACAIIDALGLELEPDAKELALRRAEHPGRLEVVAVAPTVMLDGAHNPHGARALARFVARRSERPRVLVLAVSADKDVRAMVEPLASAGVFDLIVAAEYAQARALPRDALADVIRQTGDGTDGGIRVEIASGDLRDAVAAARATAGVDGLVIVAGSLYAVGEVRPAFRPEMPVDPLAVSDPAPPRA